MKKILYIFDAADWESRAEVATKAQQKGYDISIGLINAKDDATQDNSNFKITPLHKRNETISLFSTLQFIKDIHSLIKKEKPDIIHAVTLKYSFMTGIAALPFAGTRKIFTMAGLGYLFRSHAQKSKLLRFILTPWLKFIFRRKNTSLIFQNKDDLDLFVQRNFVQKEKTFLIKGSGVYLDRFSMNNDNENNPPVVLMPTRLVHDKGISVFIRAAQILKERKIDADFQIAGGITSHNPRGIREKEMKDMVRDGAVEWLGRVNDLPIRLSQAALVVYPSHYGEGIPRVLLEACAAGKAIITTDHPGCREAVTHNKNGLLVPVKDPESTANAIEALLNDPVRRQAMGRHARLKAEQEFDIHIIAQETVSVYDKM